ncbi:MAG: hypothetical protein AB1630_11160 [bacterium]
MKKRYKQPVSFRFVKSQYDYFVNRFKGSIIFFQVGRYYEFYRQIDKNVRDALGLKEVKRTSRRGLLYGFLVKREDLYLERAKRAGLSVVVIKERGVYIGRIKERRIEKRIVHGHFNFLQTCKGKRKGDV